MLIAIAAALLVSLQEPVSSPITLEDNVAPLHGTLLTPAGETRQAAIILPGSGPTDRDGNSPQFGIQAAPYRLLAEGLAEQGIATVRIDKRGIGESAAAGGNEAALRFDHYVSDAYRWVSRTAETTGQPCVWVIGHSEGALIALALATQDDDKICGLVLLAGAGRPAGDVLREQLTDLPEPLKTQAYEIIAELEAGRSVEAPPPELAGLFRPSVQPYLISWLSLDPRQLIAQYDGPVLIARGAADLQITHADLQALHLAAPGKPVAEWENVNHVLKAAPADRAGNMATYIDPDLPLAPEVVSTIAEFILQPVE